MDAKQYKKLIAAYKPGGFARENKIVTVFDNDGGYFTVDSDVSDDVAEEILKSFEKEIGCSGPDGYQDLVELATAAGIKAEWC